MYFLQAARGIYGTRKLRAIDRLMARTPIPAKQHPSALGKFTRPRPVGALARPRLFRALDKARKRPAVWVAAPPGAGKTTLVSTYVEQRRLRTVWYRVQDDDVDPATFFHYFGLAVEAAATGRPKAALPHLTPEYLLNLPAFSRSYFEQVFKRLKAPCAFVLDNYQEIPQDAPLHDVMREFLESLPAGINVLLLSRSEPPAALAPMRERRRLAFLGAEAFKLTIEECEDIAELRKVRIEKPALLKLFERAEGWTAGVVLALEQGGSEGAAMLPPEATPEVVFDYFAGDIFGRMEREAQELLLQAAFLPSMAAHRVVELTGAPNAERVLAGLNRTNYFTLKLARPHAASPVYQFHPLFREFLLRRAQETLAPAALAKLRQKAALLLEADHEIPDAVALLVAAQAWDEAMRVMLAHAQEMLQQGRGRILEMWLRALPLSIRESAPWLLYWIGMSRLPFDPVEARGHLEQAFSLFEQRDDTAGLFAAWASIVDTFGYERGEFVPLDRWIGVLDGLLARGAGFPSPEVEARVASGMFRALMYRQPQRPDLPQWAERVQSIVLEASDARTQMILGNQLVHYYDAWVGDFERARIVIEAVRPAGAAEVGPLARIAWCAMEADYLWHAGAHEECLRVVGEGLEIIRQTGVRFMSYLMKSHGVMGSLIAGDFKTAEQLLKDGTAAMSGGRLLYRARYHYLSSMVAFYRKDTSHAVASAREAVALADDAGVPICQAVYRLGLAHALFSQGQRREALSCLARARCISRSTRIANTEFRCLSTTTYFLLERGKHSRAVPLLRRTLEIARQRGYVSVPFWTPEVMTCLFAAALEHGIEVEYVQKSIRRHKLAPRPETLHLERWPFPVRIYTLGRFSVLVDGKPLEFSAKAQGKPVELLLALVALGGRDVGERQLTEALWPNAEGDAAHRACAVTLHRLRKLLGCDAAISLQRNHLSLDPRYVWVDIWAFERWLGRTEGKSDAARLSASDRAVALYRGPFLGEHMDLTWAIPLRERLRTKLMRHLAERGLALQASGEYEGAVALFKKGLDADPLAEEFYRQLMMCYQSQDLRMEAIGVYKRCEETLAEALGVTPGIKTVALYQALTRL
jgi:LuxR family maltose regulon positive regulatory protein